MPVHVVLAGAVVALQIDVRLTVQQPQVPPAQGVPQGLIAAVDDDHVRVAQLLHHEGGHVLGVALKGGTLGGDDDLVEDPVLGQGLLIEVLEHPHGR